jgi:lipoyl synthase
MISTYPKRPNFLKLKALDSASCGTIGRLIRDLDLHTVCNAAVCPNRPDCFAHSTVTFMILGDTCTRHCTFCAVKKGMPLQPRESEPGSICTAIEQLGLKYVVITSVTRDDLGDGGAYQFARVVDSVRKQNPGIPIELLVPDFKGDSQALQIVTDAAPTVIGHNLETVPRLYREVRPEASYGRSLELLRRAKGLNPDLVTKSGIMLGLGETRAEVIELMSDLGKANCDILTIGQYLQPSLAHHKLVRYAQPEEYDEYRVLGREIGFKAVIAGPLVRSSFHAAEAFRSSHPDDAV